jgi:hypothetical protein
LKRFQRRTSTRVAQANLARGIFEGLAAKLKISKTFQEPLGDVPEAAEEPDRSGVVVLGQTPKQTAHLEHLQEGNAFP